MVDAGLQGLAETKKVLKNLTTKFGCQGTGQNFDHLLDTFRHKTALKFPEILQNRVKFFFRDYKNGVFRLYSWPVCRISLAKNDILIGHSNIYK